MWPTRWRFSWGAFDDLAYRHPYVLGLIAISAFATLAIWGLRHG